MLNVARGDLRQANGRPGALKSKPEEGAGAGFGLAAMGGDLSPYSSCGPRSQVLVPKAVAVYRVRRSGEGGSRVWSFESEVNGAGS